MFRRNASSPSCALALLLAAALGCASFPVNERLERWEREAKLRAESDMRGRSESMIAILAFSGGGTRAAAFAYGVLEELAETEIPVGSTRRPLLDEIDIITGVSGGSFPAAYYGLYGNRIFEDFEERFLRRNVQGALILQVFNPVNWFRMMGAWSRSEIASEYYDKHIFDGATFAQLDGGDGPSIMINATDLAAGNRFTFSQRQFDYLCSDLSQYEISRAVAASSAVPGVLTPVRLRNFAGSCGYPTPEWVERALAGRYDTTRQLVQARTVASYLDVGRRPWVYLVDGGVSDNLGIRAAFDRVVESGDLERTLDESGFSHVRNIVMIVVNAQTDPDVDADRDSWGLAASLGITSGISIRRYNFETIELVRESFSRWTRELSREGHPVRFHMVEVGFAGVSDPENRRYFNNLPTSFSLDDEAIDSLSEAGRLLLRESPEFRDLLADLERAPLEPGVIRKTSDRTADRR